MSLAVRAKEGRLPSRLEQQVALRLGESVDTIVGRGFRPLRFQSSSCEDDDRNIYDDLLLEACEDEVAVITANAQQAAEDAALRSRMFVPLDPEEIGDDDFDVTQQVIDWDELELV